MLKLWLLIGALIATPLFGADESAQNELQELQNDLPAWFYFNGLINQSVWAIDNDRWNPTLDVKTLQKNSSKNIATDIVFAGISSIGSLIGNYGLRRAFPRFCQAYPTASCIGTLSAYLATKFLVNKSFIRRSMIEPIAKLNLYNFAKRYRVTRLLPCVHSAMVAEQKEQQRFAEFIIRREQLSPDQIKRIKKILQYLVENPDYSIAQISTRPNISMSLAAARALETMQSPAITRTPLFEQTIKNMREVRTIATTLSPQEVQTLHACHIYGDHDAHCIAAKKLCNHVGTLNCAPIIGLFGGNRFASSVFSLRPPFLLIGLRTASQILGATASTLVTLAARIRLPFYQLIAHTPFKSMVNRKLFITDEQPETTTAAREALTNLNPEQRQRFTQLMTFIMETGCCPPMRYDVRFYYIRQNAARQISLLFNQIHNREPIAIH